MPRKPWMDQERKPTSELARLRAHELALERRVQEARDSAAGILEEARADARRAQALFESDIEAESSRLRDELRRDARERLDAARADADRVATRFEAIPDEDVRTLAAAVFRRLLARGSS